MLDQIYEFDQHYFPDVIAALTIYLVIDEGYKIIGVKEDKTRNLSKLMEYFRKSKGDILILDTFVASLFVNAASILELIDIIVEKLACDNKVTILLLNPTSDAARQRVEDMKISNPNLISQLENSYGQLYKIIRKLDLKPNLLGGADPTYYEHKENLQILLYDRTPPMSYYSWDDAAYFSLLTPDKATETQPNLIINSSSGYGNYIRGLVEDIINGPQGGDNKPIPLKEFMTIKIYEYLILDAPQSGEKGNEIYFGFAQPLDKFPSYLTCNTKYKNLFSTLLNALGQEIILIFNGVKTKFIIDRIVNKVDKREDYNHYSERIAKNYSINTTDGRILLGDSEIFVVRPI